VGEVLRAARNLPPDAPPSVGTAFDGHGTTGGAGEQLRLDIVAVGPWAPQGGGGLAALGADLTVLVVAAGSRVREVQGIVATLDELGASPGWGLVIARSRKVAPLDESALRVASYPARGFRALQRLGSARGFRALQRVGSARGFRALQRLGSAGSQRLVEPILRRLGVRGGEGEVAADVPVEVPAGLPDPAPPGAVNGNGQHPPGVVASRPMDRGASPPELVDDVPERVSGSTVSR
ncbi:MAG: hypothetical protein ACRDZQ_05945, partial [Acidimicrobiales bacterium]